MFEIIINDNYYMVKDYKMPNVFVDETVETKIAFSNFEVEGLSLKENEELPTKGTIRIENYDLDKIDILGYSSFERISDKKYKFKISKWNFIK